MQEKKNDNFEELFRASPERPESLSKNAIVSKLEKAEIRSVTPKKKENYWVEIAAAVFAVIIVAAVYFGNNYIASRQQVAGTDNNGTTAAQNSEKPDPIQREGLPEGVYAFENAAQVEEYFKAVADSNVKYNGEVYFEYSGAVDENKAEGAPESGRGDASANSDALAGSGVTSDDAGFSDTNTQNSADEGDVIKTDGRYLYIISRINTVGYVKIVDTDTMEVLSVISYDNNDNVNLSGEMYINGDRLIVLYNEYEATESGGVSSSATVGDSVYYGAYCYHYYGTNTKTCADIYDISDRANPKKIHSVDQEGSLVSSRMLGTVLYTVTRHYEYSEGEGDYYLVPEVNGEEVSCSSVIHFNENTNAYTVITATDTADRNKQTASLSILSDIADIYCSEDNLYLLRYVYGSSVSKTAITKITLNGTEISCTAQGEIEGTFDDKYSFDQYEDYLRAVTTSYNYNTYRNTCSLYILDENLEQVSRIDDITGGLDEQVKAVRFMGKTAYVITFEQTDPLFVIDLSDVKNPVVKGELYMPGYSTYLHPLGNGLLLGIGYGGDEENADMSKLKIALFDVTDMSNPTILDEFIINNGHSDANYEPKALIHYAAKNIVGIPVMVHSYNGYANPVKSYAIIRYGNNELSSVDGFVHEATSSSYYYSSLFRGVCIGDNLYTVDDFKVIEHSLSSGEKSRECVLVTEDQLKNEPPVVYYDDGVVVATSSAFIPAA